MASSLGAPEHAFGIERHFSPDGQGYRGVLCTRGSRLRRSAGGALTAGRSVLFLRTSTRSNSLAPEGCTTNRRGIGPRLGILPLGGLAYRDSLMRLRLAAARDGVSCSGYSRSSARRTLVG